MYEDEEELKQQEQPGIVEQIVDEGVNAGKRKVKKTLWEIIKPHLPAILSAIGWFFLIFLAVGLLFGIIFSIQQSFITASAAENPDSVSSVEDADIVYLGDNGEYKISVENLADQILENLETQKINNEAVGFSTENLDNMIDKYIKAEIQTTYPETGASGNEFDGIIKIYRAGTTQPLRYMKYDDFKDYSGGDVFEYFSLEPETFKLCIAREGDSVTYKDRNGNPISGIDGESNEGIIKESIEYKTALQNYSVPLNFFTTLHMMSQDVDFMNDFVDKVLGKDKTEPIVLTYVESKSTTTTKKEYYGEKTITTITETKNADGFRIGYTTHRGSTETISESETLDYYTPDYFEEIRVVTSGSLQVTKADTWLKTVEKVINENNSGDEDFIPGDPLNVANINNIYIGESDPILNEENNTTKYIKYIADIAVKEITSVNNEDRGYTIVDSQNKINVDEFAEWLINDYPRVANNLSTAPSILFYLLQQNENTQQLEKIMRYVIYKLTGINYGITENDLKYLLVDNNYTSVSSSKLLKEYIRSWENRNPPIITVDGEECYLIEDDGYGNPTVGYGVDIKRCGYTNEIEMSKYSTDQGEAVPVEIVDNIEEKVIDDKKSYIEAVTNGLELTSYQLNALISRAYNYGQSDAVNVKWGSPEMDFFDSYKTYWNQETDDKFEERETEPDDTHKLYTQYMSKPDTSGGEFSQGLKNRRYSEWTLFQTGYYDRLGKWQPEVSAERILEVCEEVSIEMAANGVYYAGTGRQDIEYDSDFSKNKKLVCASYVAVVLYRAGALDAETLNECNYNWCPDLDSMFEKVGWIKVSVQDAQPGDVALMPGHIYIYAGGDEIWDQNVGIEKGGIGPVSWWSSSYKDKTTHLWRMP